MNLPEVSLIKITLLFLGIVALILAYRFLPNYLARLANSRWQKLYRFLSATQFYFKVTFIITIIIFFQMLLTPPDPPERRQISPPSTNVIKLNPPSVFDRLSETFDISLAVQINMLAIPLLLIANLLIYLQSRWNNFSGNIVKSIEVILNSLKILNLSIKRIYLILWVSVISIYVMIVLTSLVTSFEINITSLAFYFIVILLGLLAIIFIIKLMMLLKDKMQWINTHIVLQSMGSLAVIIGSIACLAIAYMILSGALSILINSVQYFGV